MHAPNNYDLITFQNNDSEMITFQMELALSYTLTIFLVCFQLLCRLLYLPLKSIHTALFYLNIQIQLKTFLYLAIIRIEMHTILK